MLRRLSVPIITFTLLTLTYAVVFAEGPDPVGETTIAADPTAAVNFAWTLVAGFLVFFRQAGFALLGAGLIRSKNTVN